MKESSEHQNTNVEAQNINKLGGNIPRNSASTASQSDINNEEMLIMGKPKLDNNNDVEEVAILEKFEQKSSTGSMILKGIFIVVGVLALLAAIVAVITFVPGGGAFVSVWLPFLGNMTTGTAIGITVGGIILGAIGITAGVIVDSKTHVILESEEKPIKAGDEQNKGEREPFVVLKPRERSNSFDDRKKSSVDSNKKNKDKVVAQIEENAINQEDKSEENNLNNSFQGGNIQKLELDASLNEEDFYAPKLNKSFDDMVNEQHSKHFGGDKGDKNKEKKQNDNGDIGNNENNVNDDDSKDKYGEGKNQNEKDENINNDMENKIDNINNKENQNSAESEKLEGQNVNNEINNDNNSNSIYVEKVDNKSGGKKEDEGVKNKAQNNTINEHQEENNNESNNVNDDQNTINIEKEKNENNNNEENTKTDNKSNMSQMQKKQFVQPPVVAHESEPPSAVFEESGSGKLIGPLSNINIDKYPEKAKELEKNENDSTKIKNDKEFVYTSNLNNSFDGNLLNRPRINEEQKETNIIENDKNINAEKKDNNNDAFVLKAIVDKVGIESILPLMQETSEKINEQQQTEINNGSNNENKEHGQEQKVNDIKMEHDTNVFNPFASNYTKQLNEQKKEKDENEKNKMEQGQYNPNSKESFNAFFAPLKTEPINLFDHIPFSEDENKNEQNEQKEKNEDNKDKYNEEGKSKIGENKLQLDNKQNSSKAQNQKEDNNNIEDKIINYDESKPIDESVNQVKKIEFTKIKWTDNTSYNPFGNSNNSIGENNEKPSEVISTINDGENSNKEQESKKIHQAPKLQNKQNNVDVNVNVIEDKDKLSNEIKELENKIANIKTSTENKIGLDQPTIKNKLKKLNKKLENLRRQVKDNYEHEQENKSKNNNKNDEKNEGTSTQQKEESDDPNQKVSYTQLGINKVYGVKKFQPRNKTEEKENIKNEGGKTISKFSENKKKKSLPMNKFNKFDMPINFSLNNNHIQTKQGDSVKNLFQTNLSKYTNPNFKGYIPSETLLNKLKLERENGGKTTEIETDREKKEELNTNKSIKSISLNINNANTFSFVSMGDKDKGGNIITNEEDKKSEAENNNKNNLTILNMKGENSEINNTNDEKNIKQATLKDLNGEKSSGVQFSAIVLPTDTPTDTNNNKEKEDKNNVTDKYDVFNSSLNLKMFSKKIETNLEDKENEIAKEEELQLSDVIKEIKIEEIKEEEDTKKKKDALESGGMSMSNLNIDNEIKKKEEQQQQLENSQFSSLVLKGNTGEEKIILIENTEEDNIEGCDINNSGVNLDKFYNDISKTEEEQQKNKDEEQKIEYKIVIEEEKPKAEKKPEEEKEETANTIIEEQENKKDEETEELKIEIIEKIKEEPETEEKTKGEKGEIENKIKEENKNEEPKIEIIEIIKETEKDNKNEHDSLIKKMDGLKERLNISNSKQNNIIPKQGDEQDEKKKTYSKQIK